MPIKIQKDLPAKAILESENIFVMDEDRAMSQDIRPLEILILNLMPLKEETETQLLRALSNTPLQIDCTFLMLSTHVSKNTSASHINKFYVTFEEIRKKRFDGMIITGAPVEMMEFEEVNYWEELSMIMEWSKKHVTSTLHICWGAQAGLYYHYGIQKYLRESKLSGIYSHKVLHHRVPLMRSMDDYIMAPHSRYTEVRKEDVEKHPELIILAESDEAGLFLIMSRDGTEEADGLDLAQFIKAHYPHLPVLILSHYKNISYIIRALRLQLNGYLAKDTPAVELIGAIQAVAQGKGFYFGNTIPYNEIIQAFGSEANLRKRKPYELSNREMEVVQLLANGCTSKEIGCQLNIDPNTVETYKDRIKSKLDCKSALEIVVFAYKNKLVL